jgi:glycosyltransferase involved in cell wall biosynthesis
MIQASVVIPAFNAGEYIETAVTSATSQELDGLEVIVVDDHSTDDTRDKVGRIAATDPRVSMLALPVNCGPSAARNAGIEAARGKWIALLDADDAFLPGRLANLIALGEAEGADLVADNLTLVDEGDGSVAPMMPPGFLTEPRAIDLCEFIARNVSSPGAPRTNFGFLKPLMRRDFLVEHGIRYDERVRFAEDFALYVECLRAGARWWLHPTPMYRYRVRQGSLTNVQTTDDLDLLRQRLRRLLADALAEGDGALATQIRRRLRVVDRCYYYRGFTDELKAMRPREALSYLFASRDSLSLIGLEGMHQLPIILHKAWRGGYRRSAADTAGR